MRSCWIPGVYQTAAFGFFTYLAALLIRTYGMRAGDTAFPLALAFLGAMLGSVLGGLVAGRAWRVAGVMGTLGGGGVLAGGTFGVGVSLGNGHLCVKPPPLGGCPRINVNSLLIAS
jgi:hypothetical protein